MADTFTRRTMLKLGGAAGVLVVGGGGAAALIRLGGSNSTAMWRRGSYKPLIGQTFTVRGSSGRLRLTAVSDLASAPAHSDDAFALTFALQDGSIDVNDLPTFQHRTLGSFPLFVTEAGSLGGIPHYQAIINRIHG